MAALDDSSSAHAAEFLHHLFGACEPELFIEFRAIRAGQVVHRSWLPIGATAEAYAEAPALAPGADLFFGAAPRTYKAGTKDAVGPVPALWADLDRPDAAAVIATFPIEPSVVVASGTPGHLHAYWFLAESIDPTAAEGLLKRLASALGGDEAATDASRMLRLPDRVNSKTGAKARLIASESHRHQVAEIAAVLDRLAPASDPPEPAGESEISSVVSHVLDLLDNVRPTGAGWQARCPAHDDEHPSLSVDEGDDGRVLLYCHAGCSIDAIVGALDLTLADLFPDSGTHTSVAAQLVDLAEIWGVELFHDDAEQPLAWVPVDGHKEVWAVGSGRFRRWLRHQFRRRHGRIAQAQAVADAVDVLAAEAEFDGDERRVYVRVGSDAETVLIDLGDEGWRAIAVGGEGWTLLDEVPVPFLRRGSVLPLPDPVPGGSIDELRSFVNVADEASFRLFVAFLVMAMQPQGPFPILVLVGEQGAAKSTAARVIRLLVDPRKAMLRAGTPDERDLMIAASRTWVLGFDNVSRLSDRFSDALCQLSTGAGFATRQLYTDDEEVVFEAMRPTVLNGIGGVGDRPDFLSRAVVLTLPPIEETERQAEATFWSAFEAARPRIHGALLDALAGTLKRLPEVELEASPRLADFARLGVALEQTLGWPAGSFLAALDESQVEASEGALEAEVFAEPLMAFVKKRSEWLGTMTELLSALTATVEDEVARRRDWPKTPAQLGTRLRRIAPALRSRGFEVEEAPSGRGRGHRRGMRLRWSGDGGDSGDGGLNDIHRAQRKPHEAINPEEGEV